MKYDVFVRAQDPSGKWGSVHVDDLTEESFKRFVIRKMVECGLVAALKSEEEEESLKTKTYFAGSEDKYAPYTVMFRGGKE